jgi:nucleotide-binding universal stress UspA family protein
MIKKVLFAYDGSDQAQKAFDFALDIVTKYGAELLVLSVATPPEPPMSVEMEAFLENAQEYYEQHFSALRQKAERAGVTPKFEVRDGHAAEQIIRKADEEDVDMIVMGHRGKSFIERWRLGSVSKRVLSYAHCTVSVVR